MTEIHQQHGRLKIKTTAEQEEAKRKEREKKLQIYRTGTERVFEKKNNGERDEESLLLTSQLLCSNPDFYTLWNFRKEIILHLLETKTDDEDLQKLFKDELWLVEECLRKNPKSYGAWNHRRWSLLHSPQPNWERELKLCKKFLEIDERNFHCWDYRRFVCEKADVTPSDELDFTLKKIESNFSNYSAWHYRSSLLPIVYPGTAKGMVKEEKLLEEYELIQNAAFTDPNDQSVWFYHRWLLGRGRKPLKINLLFVSRLSRSVIVQLSKPILSDEASDYLQLFVNNEKIEVEWNKPTKYASSVWHCSVPIPNQNADVIVLLTSEDVKDKLTCQLEDDVQEGFTYNKCDKSYTFRDELSATTTTVLLQELESCRELQKLEPDNKWILFCVVLLMRALSSQQYDEIMFECLDRLTIIDPSRKYYFYDLKSRFLLQNVIEQNKMIETVSLSRKHLVSLHHMDYFVITKSMDLSSNSLHSVQSLCYLLCVIQLILDNNNISSCSGLENLQQLKILSLKNNNIKAIEDIMDLKNCLQLQDLNLKGNLITEDEKYRISVCNMLTKLQKLDNEVL